MILHKVHPTFSSLFGRSSGFNQRTPKEMTEIQIQTHVHRKLWVLGQALSTQQHSLLRIAVMPWNSPALRLLLPLPPGPITGM